MKVFELFRKIDFVNIIPAMVRFDPKSRQCIDAFREAYTILKGMTPVESNEKMSVEWMHPDWGEPYIKVRNCEGDFWEKNLGKEIVIGKGVSLSDEELAARILWGLTFYGFNLKEQEEFAKNLQLCHFLSDCSAIFANTKK
ncbi:MAG: hypothetical protein Q4G10_02820 [Bacteroidia bacterium]|nr:hypothetical protein [Bacteroidia bacterium]